MEAYWYYLSQTLSDIQLVSQQDISCGPEERILAGTAITQELLLRCSKYHDRSEIESLFDLGQSGFHVVFEKDLFLYSQENTSFSELFHQAEHEYYLHTCTSLIRRYPELSFRLAVLKHSLSFEYRRTLFCIWLILLESEDVKRPDDELDALFLCGLGHDLGLLDVDPKFTHHDHDPRSSKDDHNGYYSHTKQSAEFLKRVCRVSEKVLKGVEQHHENMDGTGYPKGKAGNQLSEYGQYIHLYDTLFSIYEKNYLPYGKRLADLVPIIEINAVTHFGQGAKRLVALLKKTTQSSAVFFKKSEFQVIQAKTVAMANFIEYAVQVIQDFTSSVGFRHEDKTIFMLQNSFIHIALSYHKLKEYDVDVLTRVLEVPASEAAYLEKAKKVEEHFLTLREIVFHINKFLYRLKLFIPKASVEEVKEKAEYTAKRLTEMDLKLLNG